MYKVSVLVLVYAVEQYIERCARSIFEQTYSNLEYVFVNDCTPDNSVEILKNTLEDYPEKVTAVKIINQDHNRGIAASRNTALDNATGEFVIFVDSDDWLELDAIKLLVQKQVETGAKVVSGNRLVHYPNDVMEAPIMQCHNKKEMVFHMMHWTGDQYVWGRLISRDVFNEYGVRWIEGLNNVEDRYAMSQIAYFSDGFVSINDVVYHYEKRNVMSITNPSGLDFLKQLHTTCQAVSNYVALESFFSDKESEYLEECKRCKENLVRENGMISLVKTCVDRTLTVSNRQDFLCVVGIIDKYERVHGLLEWQLKKDGLKGFVLHNYDLMKLKWLLRKVKRFARETMKKKA